MEYMYGGPGVMFTVMPVIVTLGFVFVFGIIIVRAIQGIGQWNKNNESPILTVEATIVTKRMSVSEHNHYSAGDINNNHYSTSTTYYVTFEVESGDRIELHMPGTEYGLLVEGDTGKLTFQGTRYKGFERIKKN
jgi:Na+-transporting methylmalonyl-CoA/oxaloacetate decarboxylase gamma subunit